MRTNQEIIERFQKMLQRNTVKTVSKREAEILPGKKYRDERGRMVTLVNRNSSGVTFRREGYAGVCGVSCREFDKKFSEVQS